MLTMHDTDIITNITNSLKHQDIPNLWVLKTIWYIIQKKIDKICSGNPKVILTHRLPGISVRDTCVSEIEKVNIFQSVLQESQYDGGENAHQHFPAGDKDYKDLSFPSRCCCWEWSQKWEIPAELSVAVSEELKRICFNLYFLLVIWFWAFCNLAESVGWCQQCQKCLHCHQCHDWKLRSHELSWDPMRYFEIPWNILRSLLPFLDPIRSLDPLISIVMPRDLLSSPWIFEISYTLHVQDDNW